MTPDEVAQLAVTELEKALAFPPPPRGPRTSSADILPERFAMRAATTVDTTLVLAMRSADDPDPRTYLFHFDLGDWPEGDVQSAGGAVFEVLMRCTEDPGWRGTVVAVSPAVAIVPVTEAAYRLAGMSPAG